MNTIRVKNIEIRYDDTQNFQIDYIKSVISNNYDLFSIMLGESKIISLIPTNEDEVVYISDFDQTFYKAVNTIFNNEENNSLLDNKDLLPAFYIESLVRRSPGNYMSLVKPNPNVNDEMFYSLIAYIYFAKTGTFDDFVNYLKNKADLNMILDWLQKETRFDAYNYLLEFTINHLKEMGFNFLDDISDITNIMLNQLTSNNISQENEIKLPSMTIQKLDSLFYEFLKSINAPDSWKQIYEDLKTSGRISFENQVDNIDNSMCYRDENNILRILISTDGTIKCFCSFVHEFAHYVSMQNSVKLSQFSISEFPSIFFEKLSAEFLKAKGYEADVIDKITKDRTQNNLEIYMSLSSLFSDIIRFIKKGPISKSEKVELWENHFRIIQGTKEQIAKLMKENGDEVDSDFLEIPKIDISYEVDKECDSLINSFIQNGLLLINGYQYILDTYLAEKLLKKSNDDGTIIQGMIDVTNNLSNMSLQTVLLEFSMQDLFCDTQEKDSAKLKKVNK